MQQEEVPLIQRVLTHIGKNIQATGVGTHTVFNPDPAADPLNSQITVGPQPAFVPEPNAAQIDVGAMYEVLKNLPGPTTPPMADAPPQRKKLQQADRSKENEILAGLAPKEETFKKTDKSKRLASVLAGAAGAAAGGGSVGQILALAGAGGFQGGQAFDDRLAQEDMLFEEAKRQHQVMMLSQAQEERQALENLMAANNEIDYLNALEAYNTTQQNKLQMYALSEAIAAHEREMFAQTMDFLALDADQKNTQRGIDYRNKKELSARSAPNTLSVTERGAIIQSQDEAGNTVFSNVPFSGAPAMQAKLDELSAFAPEQIPAAMAQARYNSPHVDKTKAFIYDMINSGAADTVFNDAGLFNNRYRKAQSQAKKGMKHLKGSLTSDEQIQSKMMELIINNLAAGGITTQDLDRAGKYKDTNVQEALKAFKASN